MVRKTQTWILLLEFLSIAGWSECGAASAKHQHPTSSFRPSVLVYLRMTTFQLSVNGQSRTVTVAPETPLLWVLRDSLALRGTKFGCGRGICGACTVHVDGMATRSCVLPVTSVDGKAVTTIEGLGAKRLHPVQQAWIDEDVPQCGYCQAGQIMTAVSLLTVKPHPTDQEILEAMSNNLCRCGTYLRIRRAIKRAAARTAEAAGIAPGGRR
jgi:aerobic-type carbon monoxide dehydrogenase small subunit (CoxS/CutS family)